MSCSTTTTAGKVGIAAPALLVARRSHSPAGMGVAELSPSCQRKIQVARSGSSSSQVPFFSFLLELKEDLKKIRKNPPSLEDWPNIADGLQAQRCILDEHLVALASLEETRGLEDSDRTDLAIAEDIADELNKLGIFASAQRTRRGLKAARTAQEKTANIKKRKKSLGALVVVPPKLPSDSVLRVEQNVGCELPVCVNNRRDVKKSTIEICLGENVIWKLKRPADGLLPAPEHYGLWLWLLDRFQAAWYTQGEDRPRIEINLDELKVLFGQEKGGAWYQTIDDAFTRFSELGVSVHTAYHTPEGVDIDKKTICGPLCYYSSWRKKSFSKSKGVSISEARGWIAPGDFIWETIKKGYVKAIPLQPILQLPYVSQRLLAYLMKHCRPGASYKVTLQKMLPKIPIDCPNKNRQTRLKAHHEALLREKFLACMPVFEGRGDRAMVTYTRT